MNSLYFTVVECFRAYAVTSLGAFNEVKTETIIHQEVIISKIKA